MAKKKSLNPKQINDLKEALINGEAPAALAEQFKVGVSTIHNYKARFKKDGVKIKSVRGRRPKVAGSTTAPTKSAGRPKGSTSRASAMPASSGGSASNSTFVVNGVSISISGRAKSINIDRNSEGIVFQISM